MNIKYFILKKMVISFELSHSKKHYVYKLGMKPIVGIHVELHSTQKDPLSQGSKFFLKI